MNIGLPFQGTLSGRIMRESLRGTTDLPVVTTGKRVSGYSGGVATVMLEQSVGDERYYDEACLISVTADSSVGNPCR